MRRLLVCAVGAALCLAACGDGPDGLTAPEDERVATLEAPSAAAQAAFVATHEILSDPFTLQLVQGSGMDPVAFHRTVRDMTAVDVRASTFRLSETLALQPSRPGGVDASEADEADAEILRAALALVLDDAKAVASGRLTSDDAGAAGPVRR